jgi:prolyl oligopeptidase
MPAPVARTEVVRDTYFGVTVEDPYRWLEDVGGEEARGWLEGQAARARSVLDALGHRATLLARVAELRGDGPERSGFVAAGGTVFHLRQDPGADVAALVARGPRGAPERVLLDPGTMAGEAHSTIDWLVPSPDGRHVACGVSEGGSEWSTLHVVETATGRLLDDRLGGALFPFVSWLSDGGSFPSFVYHQHRDPPPGAPPEERRLDSRSLLHRLGTDAGDDVVVLARGLNPRVPMTRLARPFLATSPDGGWLLAIVSHAALGGRATDEELTDCTLYVAPRAGLADPASCPWRRVAGVGDAVTAFALDEEALYLVTGRDAPRYQVLAVPLADPDRARVVVPEGGVRRAVGHRLGAASRSSMPRGCAATAATRRCSRPTAPTGSRCARRSPRRCWPGTSGGACTPWPTSAEAASTAGSGTWPGGGRARRPPSPT